MGETRTTDAGASAARARLAQLQPTTAAELERVERLTWASTDSALLDRCARRIDALLTGGDLAEDPEWTARDRAFLAFTDQFAFSVQHVADEHVDALLEHASPGEVYAFIDALYVVDMTRRLELVAGEVLA